MKKLVMFTKEEYGFEVRSKEIDGKPWFVLSDVCKLLQLGNPSRVADRLKSEGVIKSKVSENTSLGVRTIEINLINEGNLYRCILRSNKKEAEIFQDWIVEEVLPSIRENGSYNLNSFQIEDSIKMAEKWIEEQKKKALLTSQRVLHFESAKPKKDERMI